MVGTDGVDKDVPGPWTGYTGKRRGPGLLSGAIACHPSKVS
jgi:hypothetical protein